MTSTSGRQQSPTNTRADLMAASTRVFSISSKAVFLFLIAASLAHDVSAFVVLSKATAMTNKAAKQEQQLQQRPTRRRPAGGSITVTVTTTAGTTLFVMPPVGEFCPFRSAEAKCKALHAMALMEFAPQFEIEMGRMSLDLKRIEGGDYSDPIEPSRFLHAAASIQTTFSRWYDYQMSLKHSNDFQMLEKFAGVQVTMEHTGGMTVEMTKDYYEWQVEWLTRAGTGRLPLPPAPAGIDVDRVSNGHGQRASVNTMVDASPQVSAEPFLPEALSGNAAIRSEYRKLVRDHVGLIRFGGEYGTFDRQGKLSYLDEMKSIEDRWDVFIRRFELMGDGINPVYVRQCDRILGMMAQNEQIHRDLHRQCHEYLRKEAELCGK